MKTTKYIAWLLLTLLGTAAQAHGGEDHGAEGHAEVGAAAEAGKEIGANPSAPRRLPDGSVTVPKTVQRLFRIRTQLTGVQTLSFGTELQGQVIADPAASGRVQAAQAGVIEPGSRGLPHLGQRIAKGEVVAWLALRANGLERASTQAQLAELAGQQELAEQKVRRYAQLEGSIPQKEIEAARAELASLSRRKSALSAGLGGRVALTAPVAGVISSSVAVAGQVVDARDALFEIVDPERLMILALAYDTTLAGNVGAASGVTASGEALKLDFVGAGLALREQALPLQFRVLRPAPPLALGEPVVVTIASRATVDAIAVPRAALTRDARDEEVVWVHTSAEHFAARPVRTRPLDATRVVVTTGLAAGDRVVIEGAALLAQVR